MSTKSTQYKLRAGSPMPIEGGFVTHTFMAEKYEVDNYQATDDLVTSYEFRGQGGDLYAANYSRIASAGGKLFQGTVTHSPVIIEEDKLI